jgi:putative ABC transport system permease protein
MRTFGQDIRYGVRMLWKSPGFTLVSMIALALGIGANTAIFSVVNTVLLRPLPFNHSEQIVRFLRTTPKRGTSYTSFSWLNFADLRSQNRSFEAISAFHGSTASLTGDLAPERISGVYSSVDLFKVLDAQPQLGRTFAPQDEQPGGAQVVVISHGMWQRRFGTDPNIIGRQITLNGKTKEIIGVMPANFHFLFVDDPPEYWVPEDPKGEMSTQRGAVYLEVLGRLRPGLTIEQAKADVQAIAAHLEEQYPTVNTGRSVNLIREHEHLVGDLRPTLLVLLGAVGFVLLIACGNVANLLLARAAGRSREMAVRAALGASRWRIMRQLLTESLLLSTGGGALGLLFAMWGIDLLSIVAPANLPRFSETGIDITVLLFTLGASVLTGVAFGLAPAFHASKVDLNEALKESGRSSTEGRGRHRLRSLLIVSEVALSVVLLVGAGLLIQSFVKLRNIDPGFNPQGVLTASISLPAGKYSSNEQLRGFYQQAIEQASRLPGVESAAAISPLPLSGNDFNTFFSVGGQPDPGPGQRPSAGVRVITPEYLRAMSIPVIKGRSFTDQDTAQSPKVILINQILSRRFFGNDDPIGKRLNVGLNNIDGEIVGVVGDVRFNSLDAEPSSEYYVPFQQAPFESISLILRTYSSDVGTLTSSLRTLVRELDKDIPVYEIRPMERLVADSVARQRFSMTLIALFAGLALALAVVGIFSVMSFLVAQRTHEFGIRLALGAQTRDILGLVLRQGMSLVVIGIVAGVAVSIAVTRVMASMLYGVGVRDPLTVAAVSFLLSLVALIACMVPARRATKVDPMVALRYE